MQYVTQEAVPFRLVNNLEIQINSFYAGRYLKDTCLAWRL